MENFPEIGKFDPYRTLLVRNFSGEECENTLYNLFAIFGDLELFHCLDTSHGKYPNFGVLQYSSVIATKSALHGILSQPKNRLVLSQPWVGAFGKRDATSARQIIRGIARMNKIAIQHQSVIHRNKFRLLEFSRFGIVDHYQVQESSSVCEISYRSPLSATLAVLGVSNSMIEVTLIKNFLGDTGSDGFTLSRCNFEFAIESMIPDEIRNLTKILSHQLTNEWKLLLQPTMTKDKQWYRTGVLPCYILSPMKNNTLSFAIGIKFENETSKKLQNSTHHSIFSCDQRSFDDLIGGNLFDCDKYYLLKVFMEFNVFDANRLCKEVFRKKVTLGNAFDMQWYETPKTGYDQWFSLLILHVGFVHQDGTLKIKSELEMDCKIQPVNHFFSLLYDNIFSDVDPVVFLATPEKFSADITPVTENRLANDNTTLAYLAASQENFSYFRIPIIVAQSFIFADKKFRYSSV